MISGQKIPIVQKGEYFKYFGKSFNFGMALSRIKVGLKNKFEKYLYEIDRLFTEATR